MRLYLLSLQRHLYLLYLQSLDLQRCWQRQGSRCLQDKTMLAKTREALFLDDFILLAREALYLQRVLCLGIHTHSSFGYFFFLIGGARERTCESRIE